MAAIRASGRRSHLAADAHARVLAEDARQVADQVDYRRRWDHQAVDAARRHRQRGAVQGCEAVEPRFTRPFTSIMTNAPLHQIQQLLLAYPRYRSSERSSRTWVSSSACRWSPPPFAAAKPCRGPSRCILALQLVISSLDVLGLMASWAASRTEGSFSSALSAPVTIGFRSPSRICSNGPGVPTPG